MMDGSALPELTEGWVCTKASIGRYAGKVDTITFT